MQMDKVSIPTFPESRTELFKDALLKAQYDEDEDEDIELNEISSKLSVSEKAPRLRPLRQRKTCSLSPTSPLCWLIVFLIASGIFGWLGLFICLDGGFSRASAARRGLPGWEMVPDCR